MSRGTAVAAVAAAAIETGVVSSLSQDGAGVVHAGKTAFVDRALPGETVQFRRLRRHRQYDEAGLEAVLAASQQRVDPRCAHFGVCGGCALQHMGGAAQLTVKQQQLQDALQRIGRVTPQTWLAPLGGPLWGYRRRARLGVKYVPRKQRVVVGFRERRAPLVAALDACEVLAAPVGTLIAPLGELIMQLSVRAQLPQIELAVADNAVALVLRVLAPPTAQDEALLQQFAQRHAVHFFLQPAGPASVRPLLEAMPPLRYALPQFDVEFEFQPTDFVQINAAVNRALVARVVELLAPDAQSQVLDLYCGLGNFTLPLARRAGAVTGVEGDVGLVERARANACRNGLDNARFHSADLSIAPDTTPWQRQSYTHVLLDPPRVGASALLPAIAALAPARLVYVSCHPGSLARDLGLLVHEHGFELAAAGVVDMFPHTAHVESVALLTR